MTRINPGAWLQVNGQTIAGSITPGAQVALSDVQVTWGRRELLAQPDPATATASVFDPSGVWSTGIDTTVTDLVGRSADIGWTHAGTAHTLFRGRVASIDTVPYTLGGVRGALVTFGLVSRLADMAVDRDYTDSRIHPADWPVESSTARAARLLPSAQLFTAQAVQAITKLANNGSAGTNLRTRTVADRPLADAVTDIFTANARTMSYLPDSSTLRGIRRRVYDATYGSPANGLAGLVRDDGTGDRAGKGAYIATRARQIDGSTTTESTVPLYLDGRETGGDARVSRDLSSRLTRIVLKWWFAGTGGGTPTEQTALYEVTQPAGLVERSATLPTEAYNSVAGAPGTTAGSDMAAAVRQDNARPMPDPVTIDLGRTGGFEHLDQSLHALAGGEMPSPFFVQGTLFPQIGVRPVFAIIGGTIAHTGGRWLLTLQFAPVHTDTKQHAVTWAEIDDGTTGNTIKHYLDGADHADGLHESVTVEDLGYCATGLGVTTPGPDTGWDTLQ